MRLIKGIDQTDLYINMLDIQQYSTHYDQQQYLQRGPSCLCNLVTSSPSYVDQLGAVFLFLRCFGSFAAVALLQASTSMEATLWKASSMFCAVLALVSIYLISLCFSINSLTSSLETVRLLQRSHLLPTSNTCVSEGQEFLISAYQQLMASSNDCLSVISKTMSRACAPRQYELVMVRKRSWPAVSQICSLILLLLRGNDLNRKSTPIVARNTSENSSSAQRTTIDDLPTQELPTNTTLNRQWYSPCVCSIYIINYTTKTNSQRQANAN